MTLELPRWLLADLLAVGLIVAGGLALEVAIACYPGLPQGPGILAAVVLAFWQRRISRFRPRAVALALDAVTVLPGHPCPALPGTGPRARVLGNSVVLHWRHGAGVQSLWLTRADLPRAALRLARVCCRTRGGRSTL